MRRKPRTKPQQRFIYQVHHVEHNAATEPVVLWDHGYHEHWIECSTKKAVVTVWQNSNVHIAGFQAGRQARPLVFNKVYFDARMTFAVTLQKVGEQIFHDLGSCYNAQHAGLPGLERTGPLSKRLRV